ncbi:MAG: elongation factor P [Candidatus Aminicenantes bacterium]|nr:elongation factor P [Candidatus Aminicenantes bacterium]
MIDATQIRRGMILRMEDGQLYRVQDMQLITPGRWKAMVQTKLRSLRDNSIRDYRFRSVDRVEQVHLEEIEMEFLYQSGDDSIFMNHQTYDQVSLTAEVMGEAAKYAIPNVIFIIEMFEGRAVNVTPPTTVELKVAHTEPWMKGATAAAQYKPATMENGLVVSVPPFIQEGDILKIDTREDKYLERAK